jgi:hypothetical protein
MFFCKRSESLMMQTSVEISISPDPQISLGLLEPAAKEPRLGLRLKVTGTVPGTTILPRE